MEKMPMWAWTLVSSLTYVAVLVSSSGNTRSDGFGDNKKVDYHFQSPCDLSCWLYTIVDGTGLKQSLKVNVLLITPNTFNSSKREIQLSRTVFTYLFNISDGITI